MSGSHYAPEPSENRGPLTVDDLLATVRDVPGTQYDLAPPDESTLYSLPPVLRAEAYPEHVLSGALPPQPEPDARTYDQRTDDRLRTLEAQMHGLRNHIALLVARLDRLEGQQ